MFFLWIIFQFAKYLVATGRFRVLSNKQAMLVILFLAPMAAYAPYGLSVLEMSIRASMISLPTIRNVQILSTEVDPIGSSMAGPAVIYAVEDHTDGLSEIRMPMTPYSPYFVLVSLFLVSRNLYRRPPRD